MNIFKDYLEQISKLSHAEWQAFSGILNEVKIKKKECFLLAGKISSNSAFVVTGIFKLHTTDTLGFEKIIQFNGEHSFLADCDSYSNKTPSIYTIEAIEDASIISFSNVDMEILCEQFPVFDKIGKQITQEILAYYKEHINLLMTCSPQQKYNYMLKKYPELINRISVTNLSRFLDLSRETVSRLRGNLSTSYIL